MPSRVLLGRMRVQTVLIASLFLVACSPSATVSAPPEAPVATPVVVAEPVADAPVALGPGGNRPAPPPPNRSSPHDPPEGVVHAAVVTFNRCYKDGLRTQPSLAGSVRITFAIEENGRVSNAVASQTDLPDPAVVTCLVGAVSALTFPPQSAKVLMTLPLRFQAPE